MSESHLPGHLEQPDEIICPSCGRFVGALAKCPYCGARVEARLSVKAFRYAALLLATAGLGLLYLMAIHRDIPVVEIGSIKPTMNFAYIRVVGKVIEETHVTREGGNVRSVRFIIDDGTGEIPVTAFRTKGQELLDKNLVPSVGDRVDLVGSLSVSADRVALWLQAPDQVKIERAQVVEARLGDITLDDVGNTVRIKAEIVSVRPPREDSRRPWSVTVKDDSGKQDLNFWKDTYDGIEEKTALAPGARVRARVVVGSFRDKVQLRLGQAADLEFIDGKEADGASEPAEAEPKADKKKPASASKARPPNPIKDITEKDKGKYVKIAGEVVSITPPDEERAPYQVVLRDGDAEMPVVYWNDVADQLGENSPEVGEQFQMTGRVNIYSNHLQLKVNRATTVRRLSRSKK